MHVDLGRESRGFRRYSVDITYTGTETRRERVEFTAYNDPEVVVGPAELSLAGVTGDVLTGRFSVTDYRPRAFDLAEVVTSSPHLLARLVKRPDVYLPGWRYEFEVRVDTAAVATGGHRELVTVRPADGSTPPLKVDVNLLVTPRVAANPTLVVLSKDDVITAGRGVLVELTDRKSGGPPIELRDVTCEDDAVAWQVVETEASPTVAVRVGLKRSGALPARAGPIKLVIRVEQPCRQELQVYVLFR